LKGSSLINDLTPKNRDNSGAQVLTYFEDYKYSYNTTKVGSGTQTTLEENYWNKMGVQKQAE